MRVSELGVTTDFVKPDEQCRGVHDLDLMQEDYSGLHRYRLTYVIRDHAPAVYVQDLTEMGWYSDLDRRPPAQIPCLDDTVAQAWETMEEAVYGRDDTMRRMEAYAEQSATEQNIIKEWTDRQEMAITYKKRNPQHVASIERNIKRA